MKIIWEEPEFIPCFQQKFKCDKAIGFICHNCQEGPYGAQFFETPGRDSIEVLTNEES